MSNRNCMAALIAKRNRCLKHCKRILLAHGLIMCLMGCAIVLGILIGSCLRTSAEGGSASATFHNMKESITITTDNKSTDGERSGKAEPEAAEVVTTPLGIRHWPPYYIVKAACVTGLEYTSGGKRHYKCKCKSGFAQIKGWCYDWGSPIDNDCYAEQRTYPLPSLTCFGCVPNWVRCTSETPCCVTEPLKDKDYEYGMQGKGVECEYNQLNQFSHELQSNPYGEHGIMEKC
jgi:hypothetical protein